MNTRRPNQTGHAKPRLPSGDAARRSRGKWITSAFIVLSVVGGALWFWASRQTASLPEVNLANLDPSVARLIQNHLDEVRGQPRSAKAWGNLGSILRAYSLAEPSFQCLSEAERLDTQDPRWPYFQSLLLSANAPARAFAKLRRAVHLAGNDPEAPRLRLARLLAEAGRWDEADREIQELLRAQPEFAPALLLSARRAQARTNASDAITLARRCAADPRTARSALILLAHLHRQQGDAASASHAAQRAATLPADEPVADPYLAEAARLRNDPRILAEPAHPLLAAGRLKEAEPLVQRLINEHAEFAETWLLAGRLQFLKKDLAAAEQSLRRHLQLDPRSSQGLFQLGMVQLGREQFAEAAQTFLQATQLKPDFGPAFYNRGFALARAGDLREAILVFREAVRLNPERIDSFLMLADIHLRLAENQEAMKFLQLAEPLNPNHPGLRQLREKAQRTSSGNP